MDIDRRNLNLKPESLQELQESLHTIFSTDHVNTDEVQAVMENYTSNEDDWDRFADFDPHRYTRNLVDEGNGRFNLMILCWNEAQGSSIHSHSDAHCFLKVLEGNLRETLFAWPEGHKKKGAMRQLAVHDFYRDQVTYINDSKGLHRVENTSHTDVAVSLHLYSPPFNSCKCFDQRTGRAITSHVTFWTKFGKRTPFTAQGASYPEPENN